MRLWPGLRPAPLWGAYDAPPDLLFGWGGDAPSPLSTPGRLQRPWAAPPLTAPVLIMKSRRLCSCQLRTQGVARNFVWEVL